MRLMWHPIGTTGAAMQLLADAKSYPSVELEFGSACTRRRQEEDRAGDAGTARSALAQAAIERSVRPSTAN